MNWYIAISGILFTFLWFVWSSKGWYNLSLKFAFFAMTVWSTFLNLQALGWVVKGPL